MQLFRSAGIEPSLETFDNRLQLQKLTYLLEVFGMDLGFRFNWYLHGPYNRFVTKVLFDSDKAESEREVEDVFTNEKKKLSILKEFLGSDINSSRTLELIVSLHYLLVLGKRSGVKDEQIVKQLHDLKPYFSEEEILYYCKRIRSFIPM